MAEHVGFTVDTGVTDLRSSQPLGCAAATRKRIG